MGAEIGGKISRSRRISCAPGLAFPAGPLRLFVCFVVVVFSEKYDEKPAWEPGATSASLSEKSSQQSLSCSYTRVSLTSSLPTPPPPPALPCTHTGFRRFLLTNSSGCGRLGRCILVSREGRLWGLPGVGGESARVPAWLSYTRLGSTCSYKHCHKAVFLRTPPPPALSCHRQFRPVPSSHLLSRAAASRQRMTTAAFVPSAPRAISKLA